MPKMMGKGKHWGRWSIDKKEDNQSARIQEFREWYKDVEEYLKEVEEGPDEY